MAYATTTYLAIASIAASAVGAGMQYYSANNAADTQSRLAMMNAQAQTQAARQSGQAAQMQAKVNQVLAAKEQAAANANAAALRQQAEIGSNISAENTRKNREEMARMIALQRAQVAKAGFVDSTGSPLQLLTQTAEEEQRMSDEYRYQDEMQRRQLFREATIQENEGILAGITGRSAAISGMAAMQQANMAISQARLDAWGQRAAASAMRTSATGQLFTSAGTIGSNAYTMKYRTPPREFTPQKTQQ